jgi:membrane-bound serine protease (ClpP class)
MAPGARIGRTGAMLSVNGTQVTFGTADEKLQAGSLGFLEAREQEVLKFSTDDRGVPVLRNMLYALDGLTIEGKVLNTTVETLDDSGQIVLDAATARFFKLGLIGQLMHTVASVPVAYLLFAIGLSLLVFEFFTDTTKPTRSFRLARSSAA